MVVRNEPRQTFVLHAGDNLNVRIDESQREHFRAAPEHIYVSTRHLKAPIPGSSRVLCVSVDDGSRAIRMSRATGCGWSAAGAGDECGHDVGGVAVE